MKNFIVSLFVMFSLFANSQTNFERQSIVVPKEGTKSEMMSFVNSSNSKILQEYDQLGWFLFEIPEDWTYEDFEKAIKEQPWIKSVYPDEVQTYKRDYIPNDPQFTSQWYLKNIGDFDIDADQAWDSIPSNNQTVTVAVFDGGNDVSHEDLVGNIVTPFNAVTNSYFNGQLVDAAFDRHGTACSGTICSVTNNGIGVSSVGNNKVKVMPINIMTYITSGGSFGTTSSIQINAINAAMAQGCVAISMSYGGSSYTSALDAAFTSAKTIGRNGKGLFICASSGNGYSGTITQYPASYPSVYGIGATTSTDLRAAFSNYGTIVDISAPGTSILTTDLTGANGYSTGNYASVSGTSFSCPITAACGALLIYKNSELSESSVMNILASTCDKVGGYVYSNSTLWPYSTRSNELGYGRVNLYNAIRATPFVGNPVTNPPTESHNFYLTGCNSSNLLPTVGSSITITTNQRTSSPGLASVSPKVQYYWSTDLSLSLNDIVIGTDTSTIGNGVEFQSESITYQVPQTPGIYYILIKANFDGSETEITSIDNVCSIQITVMNPTSSGADLRIWFTNTSITTCGNNTGSGAVLRFQNVGSVPITSFTYRWRWDGCPIAGTPSYFNCNNVSTLQSYLNAPINPNQMSGTYTSNLCIANCGLASAPYVIIPVGTTRNLIAEIISVNGQTGDSNSSNNIATIPVTRISCTTNGFEEIEIENPEIRVYTITGVEVDPDLNTLATGAYVIHFIYSDHIEVQKVFYQH